MKNTEPTIFRDFSRGNLQNVSKNIAPINSIPLGVNLQFNKILGNAVIRQGTNILGAQIVNGVTCLGLTQFSKADGTKVLFSVFDDASTPTNSDIYIYSTGAWSKSSEDLTKSIKTRFVSFLNTLAFFNGTDASKSYTTSWVATAGNLDIANFPKVKYAIEWHDRIYGAGVTANPDRLYYSSIPTGGAISWTSGNGYIDIEPEVGQAITGLAKVPGYLLIFKERSLKRWNGYSTFPDDLLNIGTLSQESICYGRGMVFFANHKGIWVTNGGYPTLISRPVQKFIDAISSSFYDDIASYCDEDIARFSIGDVIVDGITYSNVVLKYNLNDKSWEVEQRYNEFRFFTEYVSSNTVYTLGGDTNGQVLTLDSGTSDYSSKAIQFILQTHELDFGTVLLKEISSMVFETRFCEGATVMARINGDDWNEIGTIQGDITKIEGLALRGNYFEFKITSTNKSGSAQIISITFPKDSINTLENYV